MLRILSLVRMHNIPILIFVNSTWIGLGLASYFCIEVLSMPETTNVGWGIFICTIFIAMISTYYLGFKYARFFKNIFFYILLGAGVIYFAFIFVLFYEMSNGFRDYQKYCSHFIPTLDRYYVQHHAYPTSLAVLDDKKVLNIRYSPENCGYSMQEGSFHYDSLSQKVTVKEWVYYFYFSEGMTLFGYDSQSKKWWQD